MSNRRFWFTVVGLLALIAVLFSAANFLQKKQAVDEATPDRSVYNSKPSGYKAWFTLMEKSGKPVKIWRADFSQLGQLPEPATMILVSPKERIADPKGGFGQRVTLDKPSIQALKTWVARGNTLIFLDPLEYWAHQNLLTAFNEAVYSQAFIKEQQRRYGKPKVNKVTPPATPPQTTQPPWQQQANTPGLKDKAGTSESSPLIPKGPPPAPPTFDAETVKGMFTQPTLETPKWISKRAPQGIRRYLQGRIYTHAHGPIIITESNESPVLVMPERNPTNNEQRDPVIILKRYGRGVVIMGSTPDIASNAHLFNHQADNYQFFTNLTHLRNQPVYVNEFIHGYTETPNLLAYYMNTPLGHVLFQIIFGIILLFWLSFRRWQPVRETLLQDPPVTMRDFIRSMAGLYHKHNAKPLALEPLLHRLEQRLRRRYRVDLAADDSKLGLVLSGLFADNKQQQSTLLALRTAQQVANGKLTLSERDLIQLSQTLFQLQATLETAQGTSHSPPL